MKRPELYVQSTKNKNKLMFDFCYSAMMGAEQAGIKVKSFKKVSDIPQDPTHIVVGSVEVCSEWLENSGFKVPDPVDITPFQGFLGRDIMVAHIKNLKFPTFIKPWGKIKAFTGFVAENQLYVDLFSEKYDGLVWSQDIVDIASEYRLYVNCNKVIGMKHYHGDCMIFPNREFILNCIDAAKKELDYHSYTLDFGILENGNTILIEINDAFAIANYGLEPIDYYYFIRNRWLQITGVRHKMENI